MKKIKTIMLLFMLISFVFFGMVKTKVFAFENSYTGTSIESREGVPYYFKYEKNGGIPTESEQDYIYTVSEWENHIANGDIGEAPTSSEWDDSYPSTTADKNIELTALHACSTNSNDYCVRVRSASIYKVGGQRVFCLDALTKFQLGSNITYTKTGETLVNQGNACALVELYDKLKFDASGNVDLASISVEDMYAIQKRMWKHDFDNTTCSNNNVITKSLTGSVTLTTTSSNMTYDSSSQYFVSAPITIKATNINTTSDDISLSLSNAPSNTIISKSKTNIQSITKAKSGDVVYLMVPKNNITPNFNVKVTATASVKNSEIITIESRYAEYTSPSGSQTMGIPSLTRNYTYTYGNANDDATFELKYGNIVITKKDVKNGFTLSGAKFTLTINGNAVRDIYGNVVGEKTSDENGKVTFENIPYGTYLITETNSPTGYQITTASQSKTLNSSSLAFDWTNAPRSISISKKDITSEDEVLGAHIQVYKYNESARTKGTLYDEFDSNTIAHSKNYEAGNYVMIETLPAPKYKKVQTAFVFSVSEEGKATLKAVGTFGDDNKFTAITDTTKKKDAEKFIKIENDNSITLYNELMLVKISKKDITGAKELAGAKIKITNDKDPNFKIEFESKKEEETKVNLEYLEPQGTKKYYYYMEETIAPKGYKKITTVFKFSVDEEGVPKLVSIGSWDKNGKFTNEKKVSTNENIKFKDDTITLLDEPIKIKFAKKDSSTSEYIKGAKIAITPESKTGKVITFETTSSDYELDLEPGIYYIRETVAPEGYQELDIEYKIEITEEKNIKLLSENADNISIKDNYIILYNTLVPVESTGVSISPLIFAGVGLLIVAGIILIIAVKKRRS